MVTAQAFKICVNLKNGNGQKTLHKYGVKTKNKATADMHKVYDERADELIGYLQDEYEGFDTEENNEANPRWNGLSFVLMVIQKVDDDDELIEERKLVRAVANKLRIEEYRVGIEVEDLPICVGCDKVMTEEESDRYGDYSDAEGRPVCYSCYEYDRCEAPATVVFSDEPNEPYSIGSYHDDTEGQFKLEYHRTDGWRGHYNVVPSEDWEELHSDAILAMSQDEKDLKDFDDLLLEALNDRGIRWARVITRTSNVFCCGYDFFVETGHMEEIEHIVAQLRSMLRDPYKFHATALTGKDPDDLNDHDRVFVEMASRIMAENKERFGNEQME